MAKIIIKKSRVSSVARVEMVNTMPGYRTREEARSVAKQIKARGLTVSAPTKTNEGWKVSIKSGTLSINKH